MQDLWERINADAAIPGFTGPLLLRAGYTLAEFSAELAGLRTQFAAVTEAENGLSIGRRQRDALLPPLRERLLQYRAAIELEYAPGHALYESLPDLSPAPGSTPDPVTANGFWEPSPGHAVLSWSASTNPNLDHYSIRMSPGPSYDSATASVIGSQPPGSAGTTTLAGLASPGDVASFKIFVVLTTSNEAGSNTVTITRMS